MLPLIYQTYKILYQNEELKIKSVISKLWEG